MQVATSLHCFGLFRKPSATRRSSATVHEKRTGLRPTRFTYQPHKSNHAFFNAIKRPTGRRGSTLSARHSLGVHRCDGGCCCTPRRLTLRSFVSLSAFGTSVGVYNAEGGIRSAKIEHATDRFSCARVLISNSINVAKVVRSAQRALRRRVISLGVSTPDASAGPRGSL